MHAPLRHTRFTCLLMLSKPILGISYQQDSSTVRIDGNTLLVLPHLTRGKPLLIAHRAATSYSQ